MFKVDQRLGTLVAMLALGAMHLSADTIASTLSTQSPPFETSTGNAWQVGLASNTELAVEFQDPFAGSYLLTQLQVADNFSVSDPNSSSIPALNDLIVTLWVSTIDDPNTATALQSWNIAAPSETGQPGQLYTVSSATPTIITPGDYYFITENVTPDGSNTAEWGWQENNLVPMQTGLYFGTYGTPDSFNYADNPCTVSPCTADNDPDATGTPAYSVSGNLITTPEPGNSALILGVALAGILILNRRGGRVLNPRR
jgi:hypothetical protein